MRYVIAIFVFACVLVWDFTQNRGAYTQQVVQDAAHFVRTTL
ncbi:hypothetical protein [Shinella zoogloeoides]|nr:hypothetical protein [Shinella zoogloeoides]